MKLREYNYLLDDIRIDIAAENANGEKKRANRFKLVLDFLIELGKILFVNNAYKPLKILHISRIWRVSMLAIKFTRKLLG